MHYHLLLNALRAFEAVGRLGSFQRAADELNVTVSAISHQVKALEERNEVILLRREYHHVVLTPEGERLLEQVSDALMRISLAVSALANKDKLRLNVTVPPSLARCWLLPRLDRLIDLFPEVALTVSLSRELPDFSKNGLGLAIHYGFDRFPGLDAAPLCDNHLFLVCHPSLTNGDTPLKKVNDLCHHTLITCESSNNFDEVLFAWDSWLKAAGDPQLDGVKKLTVDRSSLAVQAAMLGVGATLSRTLMAADAIKDKALVCPFGPALQLPKNYYAVCPKSVARQPIVAMLHDWLIAEAEASADSVKIPRG